MFSIQRWENQPLVTPTTNLQPPNLRGTELLVSWELGLLRGKKLNPTWILFLPPASKFCRLFFPESVDFTFFFIFMRKKIVLLVRSRGQTASFSFSGPSSHPWHVKKLESRHPPRFFRKWTGWRLEIWLVLTRKRPRSSGSLILYVWFCCF